MGCDPKAILYYGIELDENGPVEDTGLGYGIHGANETWLHDHGPKKPDDKTNNYRGPEWDAWREKVKAYEATAQHVEIDFSGAESCHKYYVHCPCHGVTVTWDDQIDLGRDMLLEEIPEADAAIKAFCERFNIEYKQPSWHLAVRYF